MESDNKSFIVKLLTIFLLLAAFNLSVHSQLKQKNVLSLDHKLNYHPAPIQTITNFVSVPETLYVYAIRVQFKPDNDPNTTGDGTFDMSNNYPDSVDAPPHDSLYFLNHLEFLKNYYFKSSKGKLIINYQLLGDVRKMSQNMSYYSPVRNEPLNKLGNLFFEAWKSADSAVDFTGIDPSKSSFIIFHAGVGRDIDLRSQGIFQGELDIPSLYLGLSSLRSIYGDTTQGYYTQEGVIVPSSSILPEQEYRVITSSLGNYFLEIGLNGIIVGSIGSSLGLPDLFDTQTGKTAIGRFGLMDGQSMFSFMGVFPPEPSAWEKQYLGWVEPITVLSNGSYSSKAATLDISGTSSVYKILISGKEYFLLENRNRNPFNTGVKIKFIKNNQLDSATFTSDQDGFYYADIWKLKGSIVDVDALDWSLPGYIEGSDNYAGGILIWHIDENVIDANIQPNTINTNINHRGVDLEEAKGVQQIGVVVSTPFGEIIGDGTPYDYWYNGDHQVPSNIYQNKFNQYTIPNSKSYSNFNSRVCLSNFSLIDTLMTFTYEQCSPIQNITSYPKYLGIDTSQNAQPVGFDFSGNGYDEHFVNVKDTLFGFRDNGNSIRVDKPNGFLQDTIANFSPGYLSYSLNNQNKFLTCVRGNIINLLSFNIDSTTSAPNIFRFSSPSQLTTPTLYINTQSSANNLFIGTSDGKIANLNLSTSNITYDSVSLSVIVNLSRTSSGVYDYIDNTYRYITLGKNPTTNQDDTVIVTQDNKIFLNGKNISDKLSITQIKSAPIICDLNNDGYQEIIFTGDNKVFALNRFGVFIDNFPFTASNVSSITGGCSVADLNSDGIYEVIFGTVDGRIYAYGSNGQILDGFPLLTGNTVRSTPAIINTTGNFGLLVYSTDGYLYGWQTPWQYDSTKILWRNYLADKYHSNSNFNVSTQITSLPCLPKDRLYNWPNPVYGNSTNIRYFLNGTASSVKIKIMDLSGELVATLTGPANTGFDNEVLWDVSTVQSGIYIGVIELESGSCNETGSFKIAVVK